MRRLLFLVAIGLISCGGCTLREAMFDLFSGSYTGGGTTETERRMDYNDRLRAIDETPSE